jgi:hypothetical protein
MGVGVAQIVASLAPLTHHLVGPRWRKLLPTVLARPQHPTLQESNHEEIDPSEYAESAEERTMCPAGCLAMSSNQKIVRRGMG